MVSRDPQNVLKEKIHAIDAQAESTEERDLVEALDTAEYGPVVAGPHIRLELVDECLHLAFACSFLLLRRIVDPVKLPHIEVVACQGTQHDSQRITPEEV